LDDPANDNKEKKLKHAVQWEKPSKISSIIMLSIGSAVILMVIIVTIRIIITSND
jgi:flagellar biosynthesis/type III secretory pathway M-ring protein FliF/YscJ